MSKLPVCFSLDRSSAVARRRAQTSLYFKIFLMAESDY
jgi:hypothetical protein